jgi:hypothetical protein
MSLLPDHVDSLLSPVVNAITRNQDQVKVKIEFPVLPEGIFPIRVDAQSQFGDKPINPGRRDYIHVGRLMLNFGYDEYDIQYSSELFDPVSNEHKISFQTVVRYHVPHELVEGPLFQARSCALAPVDLYEFIKAGTLMGQPHPPEIPKQESASCPKFSPNQN